MDKLGGNTQGNNDIEKAEEPKKSRRSHLLNNVFDFLAIALSMSNRNLSFFFLLIINSFFLLACLVFGLIYLLIKPVRRGFYCDDTSVQYPFKPDTIPMWVLGIYGGVGPVIIVSI